MEMAILLLNRECRFTSRAYLTVAAVAAKFNALQDRPGPNLAFTSLCITESSKNKLISDPGNARVHRSTYM